MSAPQPVAGHFFRDEGRRLIEGGYRAIPIQPGGKRPIERDWVNKVHTTADCLLYGHAGVGVVCGQGDLPVYAIDIDLREPAAVEACAAWCRRHLGATIERVGLAPKLMLVYRGSVPGMAKVTGPWLDGPGGTHQRVEVLGAGQQFVAYGVHPDTKLPYRWVDLAGGAVELPVADLPIVTPDQLVQAARACVDIALQHGMTLAPGATVVPLHPGAVAAELDPLMRDDEPVGVDLARATEILNMLPSDDRSVWISAGMALHHEFGGSDEAYTAWDAWSALSEKYPGPDDTSMRWAGFGHRAPGRRPLTFRWLLKQTGAVAGGPTALKAAQVAAQVAPAEAPREGARWFDGLQLTGTGQILPSLHNVRQLVLDHPDIAGCVRYNILAGHNVLTRSVPWRKIETAGFNGVPWADPDTHEFRRWAEAVIGKPLADRDVHAALEMIAYADAYDPLADMVKGFAGRWDGVPRLDTVLMRHLGAEDSEYVRTVTRKTFVGAVARALEPGCKHDHVLILQGEQGLRKSMFVGAMAMHTELYGDNMPSITADNDSAKEFLQGKWLVELAELAASRGRDVEHVKAFVSSLSDRYRAKFTRHSRDYPRRCAFIGTANPGPLLRDPTGGRRWWPVACTKFVDIDAVRDEMAQLWAEAYVRYEAGETRWLDDPGVAAAAKVLQEAAREQDDSDVLAGQLRTWLDLRVPLAYYSTGEPDLVGAGGETIARNRVCALEYWVHGLRRSLSDFDQRHARRINEALRRALHPDDWVEGRPVFPGEMGQQRGWVRRKRG